MDQDLHKLSEYELRNLISEAWAELEERIQKRRDNPDSPTYHLLVNNRCKGGVPPHIIRFTRLDGRVVEVDLALHKIGNTDLVVGGDYQIPNGDVVCQVNADGAKKYVIPFNGVIVRDLTADDEGIAAAMRFAAGDRADLRAIAVEDLRQTEEYIEEITGKNGSEVGFWAHIAYRERNDAQVDRELIAWIDEQSTPKKFPVGSESFTKNKVTAQGVG